MKRYGTFTHAFKKLFKEGKAQQGRPEAGNSSSMTPPSETGVAKIDEVSSICEAGDEVLH
jgi:hypothetical protein